MAIRLNTAVQNQLADSLGGAFDSGVLEIYSGAQPANANTAASGTLLASIALPADSFSAAVAGVASKAGTWSDTSANASGAAGWARFRNTGDTLRMDGSVTLTAGGGDITLDDVNIVAGGTVTVTGFTITQPANA